MEIDKYSKLGPKIGEGQRKQLINRSGPENILMPLETTGGQLKPTGQTRATNNSQATQTSRQTPPIPPTLQNYLGIFLVGFSTSRPIARNGCKRFQTVCDQADSVNLKTISNGFKRFSTPSDLYHKRFQTVLNGLK